MTAQQPAPGKIIMFDGPDGVGKSTQLELAAQTLTERGHPVVQLHVLGGTPINDMLRQALFSEHPRPPETDAYVGLAIHYSLAERLHSEVTQGSIVLVDRSPLSMIAYQVYGSHLPEDLGFALCEQALQLYKADCIIVYHAPADTRTARRAKQHKAADYFERQDQAYHARTAQGYQEATARYHATPCDASGSVADVHAATMKIIDATLQRR